MRFDVGVGDRELVVLAAYAVDDAKHEVRIRNAVAKKKYDEFLAGEIEVGSEGFVLADSAASAAALDGELPREAAKIGRAHFFVPLPAGRYVVLEGRDEEDDATPWWIRVQPAGKKKYPRRPEPQASDPVADVMARISFDDAVKEARSLEAALELIEHGRADLALSLCARASADRRYLAAFTRVLALAAAKDVAAKPEAAALANAWLAPADSATSANQMLTRAQVLRALDAAGADPALRARVAQAPEPDVFVAGGGDFF